MNQYKLTIPQKVFLKKLWDAHPHKAQAEGRELRTARSLPWMIDRVVGSRTLFGLNENGRIYCEAHFLKGGAQR